VKYSIIESMSYIASWSGGKDSCFALYEVLEKGYEISHLVNFVSEEFHRVSFHGTEAKLIQLQSQAIGIPLLQKETTRDRYEQEFKEAVRSLIPGGVEGMVFSDIYLQEHRDWVERVCSELGIQAIEPFWGKSTKDVLSEFIDKGFEAVIVCAKSQLIDRDWIGRQVDRVFMEYLKRKNIELCGENGEYHTLVTDGPIFTRRIRIMKSRTISRDGYWFLDTAKYQLSR
jgi:diphthine-ammonia ligase